MIIKIIYANSAVILKPENYTPVARHRYGPIALLLSLQSVQLKPRQGSMSLFYLHINPYNKFSLDMAIRLDSEDTVTVSLPLVTRILVLGQLNRYDTTSNKQHFLCQKGLAARLFTNLRVRK